MRVFPLLLTAAVVVAAPRAPVVENGFVYEIFVRSFADSDGDGIGDLNGVTGKLDSYLNDGRAETDHDLEVGAIWLMPVFPSPSYHGYDVSDYRAINGEYGSLEDFKTLVTEAHRRGVRVLIDLPLNHTSNKHPWFTEALEDPASPLRAWYRIAQDEGAPPSRWHRTGDGLRYFGLFSASMPDLVFDHPPVRAEAKAIAKFWLDMGVDGFRLDAAKHVFGDHFGEPFTDEEITKNNAWWREFSQFVYAIRPDATLLGEVLGRRETMQRHAEGLDGLLHDGFMNEVRAQLARPGPGLVAGWEQDRRINVFPFIGSHDRNPRLASELEDVERRGGPNADASVRLGVYLLFGLARHPVWYAGDEIMQRGWKWRGNAADHPSEPGDGSRIFDETLREPFQWFRPGAGPGQTRWFAPRYDRPDDGVSREEQDGPGGTLNLLRGITNLRTRHPVLANGDLGAVLADTAEWIAFERVQGSARYLLIINRTAERREYRVPAAPYSRAQVIFWSDGAARTWADTTADRRRIRQSIVVPPFGLVVLRAR